MSLFKVDVGICDIDSYDMLFYSHYVRYNERAASHCIRPTTPPTGGSAPALAAQLTEVHFLKYIKSVRWTDDVHIRTSLAGFGDDDDGGGEEGGRFFAAILLHEWLCEGRLVSTSVAEYRIGGSSADLLPIAREAFERDIPPVAERRRRMLQMDATVKFEVAPSSYREDEYTVFRDMLGEGGELSKATVMDLMERQRTDLIGGQSTLERLKSESNVLIVVYTIQRLRFSPTVQVAPWDILVCRSGCVVEKSSSAAYYCVHQQIAAKGSAGEAIVDGFLKLVFVTDGAILREPPEIIRGFLPAGDQEL